MTYFHKELILDVWLGSKLTSVTLNRWITIDIAQAIMEVFFSYDT